MLQKHNILLLGTKCVNKDGFSAELEETEWHEQKNQFWLLTRFVGGYVWSRDWQTIESVCQIWPITCFCRACELRMVFTFVKVEKHQKKNTAWYMKMLEK